MSTSSQTSVGVVALDSAGKKRQRSESFNGPIKKLKALPARLSFSLQSSMLAAQSLFADSTPSGGKLRSNATNSEGSRKTTPNLTTQVNPKVQQLVYQSRNSERVPGATTASGKCAYVFPHADESFSEDYIDRFKVVVDIFRQNLQEYDQMALKYPPKTEYKLKMCGTSLKSAKPSILIYHPQVDKKTGQMILRRLHRPQVLEQFRSTNMIVCFDIYWFNGPAWTSFGRPRDGLNIRIQDSYIPGALLLDDECDRISTITCGIRLDGSIFLLTAAHAFEEDDESSESDIEPDMSFVLDEDEDEDRNIYRFGDIQYDMAKIGSYDDMDKQDQLRRVSEKRKDRSQHAQSQSTDLRQTSEAKVVISPSRVWGRPRELKRDSSPNLDWALIEIGKSEQWKANEIELALHDIPGLGYQKRDVKVITSRGSLYGTISSIPSFIANSNKLSSLCKVWTVSLVDSSQMSVGDSGALVIDCLTEKAYGFVIGINHFQELYVIPLQSVLEQILRVMPSSNGTPEIFMALGTRLVSRQPPKYSEDSRLADHLYQYRPKKEVYNINTSFYKAPSVEAASFETTSSASVYVDCPTSPMLNDSNGDIHNSLHSLTTSFTSRLERTQSPATQYSTIASFRILNDSIDGKIYDTRSPTPSFEDAPPSSDETAKNGSTSAPSSPK